MNTLHTLFDWLLAASLRASVLTLLVLVIQWMLQRRLSPRWRYALWLPVLIVLLTPVLPESRWSIESVFQAKPTPAMEISPVTVVEEMPRESLPPVTQLPVTPSAAPVDWNAICLMTWAFGTALLLLAGGGSFLRVLLRIRRSRQKISEELISQLTAISREVGLRHPPQVLMAEMIQSPAVTGLLRPTLLLPAGFERDFTAAEAHLILQHELTHLKRHDLPLNTLLCVLMALHWFNPLLWLAFFMARADREAACDAQVLANATPQRRSEYGHALLKIESAFAPLRLSLGFVGMLQRGAALRARIRSIAAPARTRPLTGLLTALCIFGMTFLGVTRAEKAAHEENADPLIAIEIKIVQFDKPTDWDFGGRLSNGKTDSKTDPFSSEVISQSELTKLVRELMLREDVTLTSYPRMVTSNDKEIIVRSVVNQPFEEAKGKIAYMPVGLVMKLVPKLTGGRMVLSTHINDSTIVKHEPLMVSSRVFQNTLEADEGVSHVVATWEDGQARSRRPILYIITPSQVQSGQGGIRATTLRSFETGKSAFRPGDSIFITSMSRTNNMLTVKLDYELDSTDEAIAALYITSATEKSPPFDKRQEAVVKKGRGSLTLQHPKPYAGMPHVTFYDAKTRKPIGGIYFGTEEEANASQKLDLSYMTAASSTTTADAFLASKLDRIILPRVVFNEVRLEDALEFLRVKSRAHDTTTSDEKRKGVPIILRKGDKPTGTVSVDLTNIPLKEALKHITELAGCQYRVTPYAVLVEQSATMKTPSAPGVTADVAVPMPKSGTIILPQVEFRDVTLADALDFIRVKSRDLDPAKKGVNIVVKPGMADLKAGITLSLKEVPVSEALRYIAELSNHRLTADTHSFCLTPIESDPAGSKSQDATSESNKH